MRCPSFLSWASTAAFALLFCNPNRTERTADNEAIAQTPTASWTEYLGTQDKQAPWARLVRGPGRGVFAPHENASLADSLRQRQFFAGAIQTHLLKADVLVPIGGLGAARDSAEANRFLTQMEVDSGAAWRSLVAANLGSLTSAPAERRIFVQVGNEINSMAYSRVLQSRTGQARPTANDAAVIALYVEYFLAPTVEAIRGVNATRKPTIVLGTIANASSRRSLAFLDSLLGTTIQGWYAPTLAGYRVSDVIQLVAVHYLASWPSRDWRNALRHIHERWVLSGNISGVWATEEIPPRLAEANLGAVAALRVLSRYLDSWLRWGYTPIQGRVSLFAWERGAPGTRAADALGLLWQYLGDGTLTRIRQPSLGEATTAEVYGFTGPSSNKHVVIALHSSAEGAHVNAISLGTGIKLPARAQVLFYSPTGVRTIEASVTATGVRLHAGLHLDSKSALVLLLTESTQP